MAYLSSGSDTMDEEDGKGLESNDIQMLTQAITGLSIVVRDLAQYIADKEGTSLVEVCPELHKLWGAR